MWSPEGAEAFYKNFVFNASSVIFIQGDMYSTCTLAILEQKTNSLVLPCYLDTYSYSHSLTRYSGEVTVARQL